MKAKNNGPARSSETKTRLFEHGVVGFSSSQIVYIGPSCLYVKLVVEIVHSPNCLNIGVCVYFRVPH